MSNVEYDKDIWPLGCSWIYPRDEKKKKILKVMVVGAHPDDPDLLTGGLALKLTKRGHRVKYVSLTNGNMGHQTMGPIDLAARELKETQAAADALGAEYECLNINDGCVYVTHENLGKVIGVIRKYDPDLVITHRLNDYHRDHRYTSQLVMDASYMLIVPHYFPEYPIPESRKMPVFMYSYDSFEKPYPFVPNVLVDITDVYKEKAAALINHESQMMEWLPWTMNQEDLVPPDYDINMRYQILELLLEHVFSGIMSNYRKLWKKGFKKKPRHGEAFEICEYGEQPSRAQLKEFFPDCYIPRSKELEKYQYAEIYKKMKKMEKRIKKLEDKMKGEK
ncbi:MAG: PIG-L family deacetylase [Candidatus Lokiarchaeota archaeon]|nr:PIG-L family deacetylase [Candidatus Lokiarchaeota archaeon]